MNDLLLTPEEAQRFASWLEREAVTAEGLADQARKLGTGIATIVEAKERPYAAACLMIARRIRNTESQTIG